MTQLPESAQPNPSNSAEAPPPVGSAAHVEADSPADQPFDESAPSTASAADQSEKSASSENAAGPAPSEPPPSYVKLAMRNMVKKGSKSLFHFTLTTVGLMALLVGLAYLTR